MFRGTIYGADIEIRPLDGPFAEALRGLMRDLPHSPTDQELQMWVAAVTIASGSNLPLSDGSRVSWNPDQAAWLSAGFAEAVSQVAVLLAMGYHQHAA